MSNLSSIFTAVCSLQDKSDILRPQPIERDVLKLTEEVGEIAADVLKLCGYKVTKEDRVETRENLRGEIADVIIMAMVLAHKSKVTEKELRMKIHEKLQKWEETHIRPFDDQ
jgi:NTP pyrophosphatase (non-canonical NTP hydrolase)